MHIRAGYPPIFLAAFSFSFVSLAHADSLKDVFPTEHSAIWTGVYIGAGGGVNSLVTEFYGRPGPDAGAGSDGASALFDGLGSSGGFATLSLGADYQFG